MAVLTMSAGLLLVLSLHIRGLFDGLPVSHLGLIQFNLHLVFVQQAAGDDLQVLIAHAVQKKLAILCVIDHFYREILMGNLLKRLGNLVDIPLIFCLVPHIGVGRGNLPFTKLNRSVFGGQTVAGAGRRQLRQSADIPCVKFAYFHGLIALHYVQLADLLLDVFIHIVDQVVRLEHAGIHLDQRVLADKGIHDGFPNIGRLCLGEIIVRMVNLVGLHIDACHFPVLRAGHIFHDVIQQSENALTQDIGPHGHGYDAAIAHIGTQCRADLGLREGLPIEEALHHLLTGLRHRLHQGVPADLQIGFIVLRHLAGNHFLTLPAVAGLGNHIHIAHEFLILTNGQIEGGQFLAKEVGHILHHLAEGCVVHIHIGHIHESGQFIFLTQLPSLQRAHLNAGLAVHHDDGGACGAQSLFHFSHEIKIPRGVENINLMPLPLNGNDGCTDGKLPLLLFFSIITYSIAICYFTHSGSNAGQVCHRLNQAGLTAAAMT